MMRNASLTAGLTIIGALLGLLHSAETFGQLRPLAEIETIVEPWRGKSGDDLHIRVYARDLNQFAAAWDMKPPQPDADSLEMTLGKYPQFSFFEQTWLDDTFLIDYRESSVQDLARTLPAADSHAAALKTLVSFVSKSMAPSDQRGWDLASRVARQPEGDCTEHAVLLVALARAIGIPARVALGLAIFRQGGAYRSYGHAWGELFIDGRWQVADAALANAGVRIDYLPFGVLQDEGPGFILAVAEMTPVWAQKIVVLRPAERVESVR